MAAIKRPNPRRKKAAKQVEAFAPPDWKNSSSTVGGNCWDIPLPWVMRFPNDQGVRQTVTAKVTTWRGFSMGATHFYAIVEPEPNAVWDGREITWRRDLDSKETKKEEFRASVHTREQAVRFVEAVLRTFYADEARYAIETEYGDVSGLEAVLKKLSRDLDDV